MTAEDGGKFATSSFNLMIRKFDISRESSSR